MASMARFGLFGKIIAQPGKRNELAAILLEAAAFMQNIPGCELYIVNISPTEPDVIWVTEAWKSQADHQASLSLDGVRAMIGRGMPLIAGGERIAEFQPLGGKGLSLD